MAHIVNFTGIITAKNTEEVFPARTEKVIFVTPINECCCPLRSAAFVLLFTGTRRHSDYF